MGDTIEDIDMKIEQKNVKIYFLQTKKGLPDAEDSEKKINLGGNKISSKRKSDRIIDKINNSLNNYKHIKNKEQ